MDDLSCNRPRPKYHRTDQHPYRVGYHRNVRQTRHHVSCFYTLVLCSYVSRVYLTHTWELAVSSEEVSICTTFCDKKSEQFSYEPHLYVSYNYHYKYPLLPYTVLPFGLHNKHAMHFFVTYGPNVKCSLNENPSSKATPCIRWWSPASNFGRPYFIPCEICGRTSGTESVH